MIGGDLISEDEISERFDACLADIVENTMPKDWKYLLKTMRNAADVIESSAAYQLQLAKEEGYAMMADKVNRRKK